MSSYLNYAPAHYKRETLSDYLLEIGGYPRQHNDNLYHVPWAIGIMTT